MQQRLINYHKPTVVVTKLKGFEEATNLIRETIRNDPPFHPPKAYPPPPPSHASLLNGEVHIHRMFMTSVSSDDVFRPADAATVEEGMNTDEDTEDTPFVPMTLMMKGTSNPPTHPPAPLTMRGTFTHRRF